MKHAKPVAGSNHGADSLTSRTFVRAACFANLLILAVAAIEFLAMAVVFRDATPLLIVLVLLPLMTLAIWVTAAVLGTVLLLPRWLWSMGHDLVLRTGCPIGGPERLWDEWLDWPYDG